jgi:hypothetical protein
MKKAFCLRVSTTAARCAAACFSRHLRDLGAGLREKGRARNRLTGIRTRGLAAAESAAFIWDRDVFVSRRAFAAHCHVSPDLRSADNPNKLTRWPISIYEYMP